MSEPIDVTLPITRVTLFEDRGEVRRAGPVPVSAGRGELRLAGLSPLLDDARLTARFADDGAGRVEAVQITRRWITQATVDGARLAELEAARQAAEAQVQAAQRRVSRAAERAQAAAQTLERFISQVGRAVWSGEAGGGWPDGLAALEAAADAADAAHAQAAQAAREAQQALDDRLAGLAGLDRDPERRLVADVVVRYHAPQPGEPVLHVDGVTPCALWRPSHEAERLASGQLRWTTGATVWQRTGEPWDGVELVLSTDRPSARAELAPLRRDRLSLQAKAHKKKVMLSHRDEAIAKDDGGAAVPGVYDGGEARVLRADGPVSIPSDGRPHRVAAGGFTTDAALSLRCRPELSTLVFQVAELHNAGADPLLAGPVRLLVGGAYVGEGEVAYVGPGEAFEQSFGSDDRFTVTYERHRHREKKLIGSDRTHFVQAVTVRAVGGARATVEVELRQPVSELDALQIKRSGELCSDALPAADGDGRVRKPVDLAPGDAREIVLAFWMDAGSEVVLADPW